MTTLAIDRRSFVAFAAAAGAAGLVPAAAGAQQPPAIEGFRSAKFGMDEKAVKAAIKADMDRVKESAREAFKRSADAQMKLRSQLNSEVLRKLSTARKLSIA